MKYIIITNNPKIRESYGNRFKLLFVDGTYRDVLIAAQRKIHENFQLETHPLSGSIKPNETPFRTLVLSFGQDLDTRGLLLIEEALAVYEKFQKNEPTPLWVEKVLEDFMTIDYSISSQAIDRLSPYPIY